MCGILSVVIIENIPLLMVRTVPTIITVDRLKIIEHICVDGLLELSESETAVKIRWLELSEFPNVWNVYIAGRFKSVF